MIKLYATDEFRRVPGDYLRREISLDEARALASDGVRDVSLRRGLPRWMHDALSRLVGGELLGADRVAVRVVDDVRDVAPRPGETVLLIRFNAALPSVRPLTVEALHGVGFTFETATRLDEPAAHAATRDQ